MSVAIAKPTSGIRIEEEELIIIPIKGNNNSTKIDKINLMAALQLDLIY